MFVGDMWIIQLAGHCTHMELLDTMHCILDIVNVQLNCVHFVVSQMQRMINQIGGQMDNLELRDKLYDSQFLVLLFHFYSASYALHGICHGSVSLCVSVTSRSSTKMAKRRIMQTTLHDSPETSFLMPKIIMKFRQGHPQWGRQMSVG